LWVQKFLIEKISERFPLFQFLCEEGPDKTGPLSDESITVIIDPIDGTSMFSMHLPFWCVSVGIFKGFKPEYGFVYSPASDMFFHTDENYSYLNNNRLIVNHFLHIESETNIFYSSEIRNIKINFRGKVRNLGSTALHACLTADNKRNRVLAFIGRSFLWDWAGAIPILQKADVYLKYLNGSELDYKKIVENNFELEDYAVAYTNTDFNIIRNIFSSE